MKPRWLFNENMPRPAVEGFRALGWDVLSISDSRPGISDTEVMQWAVQEQRWLATFDRDYGELIYGLRYPCPPALVLLRLKSYLPHEPADWLDTLFDQGLLIENYFHQFDGETVRRRPFPSNDRTSVLHI